MSEKIRVIAIPPNLPIDDLGTPALFEKCLGLSFDMIGHNGDLVELAVGAVMGEAPHMHSIWIEKDYTDFGFPQFRLSSKMLRFVIEAVDYRIDTYSRMIDDPASGEDDIADAVNDRALLIAARDDLRKHLE